VIASSNHRTKMNMLRIQLEGEFRYLLLPQKLILHRDVDKSKLEDRESLDRAEKRNERQLSLFYF
jgi:hypothetical protein